MENATVDRGMRVATADEVAEYRKRFYEPAVRLANRLDGLAEDAMALGFQGIAEAFEDAAMYARWNAAECLGTSVDDWSEMEKVEADAALVARARSIHKASGASFYEGDAPAGAFEYRGSSEPRVGERFLVSAEKLV